MGGRVKRMLGQKKLAVLFALGTLAVALFLSGSMAAYHESFGWSAGVSTENFELKVNDSAAATQSFSDISLPVNTEITRSLRVNTAELRTAASVTITLTARAAGTMPSGLVVKLDGSAAQRSGNVLTASVTVANAQEQVFTKDVSFYWTLSAGEDFSQYAGFSMSYDVQVEAVQQ
ncbi:MAG: hypothetical protein BWY25_03020 [Chloroflexi bacterium ADurb.Bin222]|jgi:hypothetical protein|nr:MAG: hypothetical protein BWY25_03020 [Chloroflexi bacterium ADurb.Bin222]